MWRWTALAGVTILSVFVGLGRPAIQDADEGFYAEAGREMVQSGDWITPHFNDAPRLNKPILYYWLVAADYRLAGVSETSARLWSALAAMGLAFATAGLTRRWIGPGPDLLAGGIVGTSLGLTRLARSALPDVPLACFVTIAIWAAFEVGQLDRGTAGRRRWLAIGAIAAALGFLTKGPVAWVLIAIVVAPVALWERRRGAGGSARWSLGVADVAIVAAVVVAIAAPWFVLATMKNGTGFLHAFFVGENVDRFLTDRFNAPQPAWYYLPVVAGGLLPWSPFLLLFVRPLARLLRTRRMSSLTARLAVWGIAPLAFFTLSTGKQPRYIVPCLVPIAVLVAREVWHRLATDRGRGVTVAGALAGSTMVAIGGLAERLSPVLRAADPHWTSLGPILLAAAGLVFITASFVLHRDARVMVWVGAAAVAAVAVEATVYWPARPEAVERVAARVAAVAPTSPVCSCNAFARNLDFYVHGTNVVSDSEADVLAFLASPSPSLAIVDEVTLNRIEAELHRPFERLLTVPYLDTARLRLGDALRDPDPLMVRSIVLVRTP